MSSTALIKMAQKHFGLDDDTYRAKLVKIVGKASTKDMTEAERLRVVTVFRNEGFAPASGTRLASAASGRAGKTALDGKYLAKLRAMWIALYNLGEVHDRRDSALEKWAIEQSGLDGVRFIHTAASGRAVVEALKAWMARAGVRPAASGCPTYAVADGYRIALAQWRILHPDHRDDYYLWPIVTGLLDLRDDCRDVSPAQWIEAMNYLGKQVRAAKKDTSRRAVTR